MVSTFLTYALVIGYIGLTIYLANREEHTNRRQTIVRTLLYGGVFIIIILGIFVVLGSLTGDAGQQVTEQGEAVEVIEINTGAALVAAIISAFTAFAGFYLISSEGTRLAFERLIGEHGGYRAASMVHTTAIILALMFTSANFILFLAEGGTSGMAESIETDGVSGVLLIFQAIIEVLASFLGVGYAIRRDLRQALQRLGLRWPTQDDVVYGVAGGLLLLGLMFIYGIILTIFYTPEEAAQQNEAAQSLARAFATVPLALLLSVCASVGEEILFRGALQPIFGNVLTSILFVLLHTQSLLSPGILMLFVVSMILGRIRNRYSTTAAIAAHFTYNFIQLLLLILATSAGVVQP